MKWHLSAFVAVYAHCEKNYSLRSIAVADRVSFCDENYMPTIQIPTNLTAFSRKTNVSHFDFVRTACCVVFSLIAYQFVNSPK